MTLIVGTLGCGASSSETVELEFWAFGNEGEAAAALLEEFSIEHPEIRVSVQPIPWIAAHEKLLTAFAADNLPDVCQLGNTWIPEFVALDALQPLDHRIARSAEISATEYFPGIWDTNRIGDRMYGVPWYVDTRVLLYRRDLLSALGHEEPPTTWEEWLDIMAGLRATMPADAYPILLPTNEWEQLTILGLQVTDGLLRDGGRYGDFRSAGFRRTFEFYLTMFDRSYAPHLRNTQWGNVYHDFAEGRYAMYVTGPWNVGEFQRYLPADTLERWSAAPLPSADSTFPGASLAGGCSLVIPRTCQNQPAAWKLIEFLSRPEQQLRFYKLVGDLPARNVVWKDEALTSNRWTAAFYQQLSRVEPAPRIPEWERIATEIYKTAEAVIDGGHSPEAALESLDRRVNAVLAKRRWMLDRQLARYGDGT